MDQQFPTLNRPASPHQIHKYYLQMMQLEERLQSLNPGEKGAIVGTLNKVLGGDLHRKIVLHHLFGTYSTKDLNKAAWMVLFSLCGHYKVEGKWTHLAYLTQEAYALLDSAGIIHLFSSPETKALAEEFGELPIAPDTLQSPLDNDPFE